MRKELKGLASFILEARGAGDGKVCDVGGFREGREGAGGIS